MESHQDVRLQFSNLPPDIPGSHKPLIFSIPVDRNNFIDVGVVLHGFLESGVHDKDDPGAFCFSSQHFKKRSNGNHVSKIQHIHNNNRLVFQIDTAGRVFHCFSLFIFLMTPVVE